MTCSCFCGRKMAPFRKRQLFIFDFDRTIVADPSDKIFKQLVAANREVTESDEELNREFDWRQRGQALIDFTLDQGVTPDSILGKVRELDLVPDMQMPLKRVKSFVTKFPSSRLLVLSGTSNDLFIETRMTLFLPSGIRKAYPQPPLEVDILTHKAFVSPSRENLYFEQLLNFDPHCPICQGAFCKGAALAYYFQAHTTFDKKFERIHFICDGSSDLCPALRLSEKDFVYVREGEKLEAILRAGKFRGMEIAMMAEVRYWSTGEDLEEYLDDYIV